MQSETRQIRIGDLLIKACIVQQHELAEAMDIASSLGLPIGKVMVMSGYLDQSVLQAAIQVQTLLRDNMVAPETALRALQMVKEQKQPLPDALRQLGWQPKEATTETKLGDLLVAAGLVAKEDLLTSLETSKETGLPLGRVLFNTGKVSDTTLWAALNAQVMIRDKKINKEQAVKALRAAYDRQQNFEMLLSDEGVIKQPQQKRIKLGELLVLSGFLSQEILMTALEVGLLEEKPLGQVLVQRQIITRQVLDCSLQIQEMMENHHFMPVQAAEILRLVITRNLSISQAIAELGLLGARPHETIRFGELLKLSGLVTEDDINEALRLSVINGNLLGKILVATGQLDELLVHAALRCQFLIREGFLKQEQAVIALNYCQRMRCTFDDALVELGWKAEGADTPVEAAQASQQH